MITTNASYIIVSIASCTITSIASDFVDASTITTYWRIWSTFIDVYDSIDKAIRFYTRVNTYRCR